MQREIKFKAISKGSKKWVFGLPCDHGYTAHIGALQTSEGLIYIVKDTLCEFIGKQDKNGVDIYENDYLVDYYIDDDGGKTETLQKVVYCKYQLAWCVDGSFKQDQSALEPIHSFFYDCLEVKGNVHDANCSSGGICSARTEENKCEATSFCSYKITQTMREIQDNSLTEIAFKDLKIGQEFFSNKGDIWFENRTYFKKINEDLAENYESIVHYIDHNTTVFIDAEKICPDCKTNNLNYNPDTKKWCCAYC